MTNVIKSVENVYICTNEQNRIFMINIIRLSVTQIRVKITRAARKIA